MSPREFTVADALRVLRLACLRDNGFDPLYVSLWSPEFREVRLPLDGRATLCIAHTPPAQTQAPPTSPTSPAQGWTAAAEARANAELPPQSPSVPWRTRDCQVIRYMNREYRPGPRQAPAMCLMWEAWENADGEGDVHQTLLLQAAGSDSTRLSDLFKRYPDIWRDLITSDRPGYYRLAFPRRRPPEDTA